ncbi:YtxH domain-containing protein [Fulvivirgaceae bacterium BMA12]|uniref:YtxH domain-containing protein n=1 Tax=Agaribacillus aureus TaxID=3051825 RepID=A0ABT8L409_9BACT|nr:YtxH domain-containing protein [Fulvivirgaceae bacterium BMA12]
MKSSGKILLTFLGGAAAGALAGMLFAPESGKKTRQSLTKKARDLRKNLEDEVKVSMSKSKGFTFY